MTDNCETSATEQVLVQAVRKSHRSIRAAQDDFVQRLADAREAGVTWASIAEAVGDTRQGLHRKWRTTVNMEIGHRARRKLASR